MVEAMVVIAIAAILTALAVPSMRNLIESNSVSDSVDSLTGSIAFARAESIKRGIPVALCPSEAAKTGTVACGSGDAWSVGWIIFVDYAGDGVLASSDTVLRVQGSFEKNGVITTSAVNGLRFRPIGTIAGIAANFAFAPPSSPSLPKKWICVSSGGRMRVITEACSS